MHCSDMIKAFSTNTAYIKNNYMHNFYLITLLSSKNCFISKALCLFSFTSASVNFTITGKKVQFSRISLKLKINNNYKLNISLCFLHVQYDKKYKITLKSIKDLFLFSLPPGGGGGHSPIWPIRGSATE